MRHLQPCCKPGVRAAELRHERVVALQDPWGRLVWLWDRPPVKRVRLTISMAQWSVRLPALLALIATQARPRTPPPHLAAALAACAVTRRCWHPHSSPLSVCSSNAFNTADWSNEPANLEMSSFKLCCFKCAALAGQKLTQGAMWVPMLSSKGSSRFTDSFWFACHADWAGGQPVQSAHAGAAAVWDGHPAALHPHQRLPHLPPHRRRRRAALDALVLQQRCAEHGGLPAPAGKPGPHLADASRIQTILDPGKAVFGPSHVVRHSPVGSKVPWFRSGAASAA